MKMVLLCLILTDFNLLSTVLYVVCKCKKMNKQLEVFLYFLKLGITGFGGPVALVAIMQKELVEEQGWIDKAKFFHVLPLLKAMPGAFSFQTAVYLGFHRAGKLAGFLAGLGLILPASILMILLGVFLNQVENNLEIKLWMNGFQWGAIVLMAAAVESLAKSYWQDKKFWILILGATFTSLAFNPSEIALVLFFGILALGIEKVKWYNSKKMNLYIAGIGGASILSLTPSLLSLFYICFSSGAFVFGTGIAITPILEKHFVTQYQWISHDEFMTALALSQMTPGPVLVIVTLIGYKTLGYWGAIVATLAVFSPGWIHMLTWFPRVADKLVRIKTIQIFLKGALAAVVTSISITLYHLSMAGNHNIIGIPMVIAMYYLNKKFPIKSWLLILVAGLLFRSILLLSS